MRVGMVGTIGGSSKGSRGRAAMVAEATGIALADMVRVVSMEPPMVARASIHRRAGSTAVPITTGLLAGLGTVMGSISIIQDMATATAGMVTGMAMATSTLGMATGMGRTMGTVSVAGRGRSSLAIRVLPHTLAVKARQIRATSRTVVSARRTGVGIGAKAHSISARRTVAGIRAKVRSISGIRGSGTTRRMVAVVPPPCAARGYPLLRPTSRVAMSAAPKVAALSIRHSAVPAGIV